MADPNQNDDNRQDRPGRDDKRIGPGGNRRDPNNNNMVSRGGWWWLLILALLFMLFIVYRTNSSTNEVTPAEFLTRAQNKDFKDDSVFVEDERMIGELKTEATGVTLHQVGGRRISAQISRETKKDYVAELRKMGQPYKESTGGTNPIQLIGYLLPIILLGLVLYFFLFRVRNAGGGAGMLGNFGRSRHKVTNKETSTITLADVAGIDEAKDEVFEIVEFLKNPKKFQRLGGRVPRGVLLIGSPGCGKTLLAKAVAGEADVPFFSISGSDFVEMFVGVGASRVRDLFKQAKESSPCIIFLDEIDAVGRRRGNGNFSGGHDEREQTLNAILVEMDGFETNDQVIVMAATNRSDVLDPALTRPGRFDRQIHVPLPDLRGRIEILKVHSKKIKMSPEVDVEKLARGTPMFSGADLAALINEAAIAATLANKDFVDQSDLEEARDKVRFGRANKSRKIEEKERVATAYHEAGHAVVQWLLKDADPVHKVTIIPRGRSLGATFSLPENDRYGYGKRYMLATMRVLCGGRIAEEKKTGDVTSGAAMDIRMSTSFARAMLLEWGMSDKLGFVDYTPNERIETMSPEKAYSENTAQIVDDEIKRITNEAFLDCTRIIEENWAKVEAVGEALLRYETLNRDELDRLMKGETLAKPTVGDLLKAEANRNKPAVKPPTATPDAAAGDAGTMPAPA
jgi:cell division protease FtsH